MQIRTFESSTNEAVVSMSGFLQTYETNIRQSIIPASQLPIYLTDYSVSTASTEGDLSFTTLALVPTNIFSKRIWQMQVQGHFKQSVDEMTIHFQFQALGENDRFIIGFEGPLGGTFVVNGNVLDASLYWSYVYASDDMRLTLRFTNSSEMPVDTSALLTRFQLTISIQNVLVTSCKAGTVPYPPDNLRNIYCIHNDDPTGALGGFAVSGEVVYRDFGQNYRLTPTFLGTGYKLLFTLTYADPTAPPRSDVGAFMGSIFDLQYVGGGMGNSAYITFENKTNERVCVWINPTVPADDRQDLRTYTYVDPGRNTVAYTIIFSNVFRWFDGQYDPCLPLTS